jgi:hypothetical protein
MLEAVKVLPKIHVAKPATMIIKMSFYMKEKQVNLREKLLGIELSVQGSMKQVTTDILTKKEN